MVPSVEIFLLNVHAGCGFQILQAQALHVESSNRSAQWLNPGSEANCTQLLTEFHKGTRGTP